MFASIQSFDLESLELRRLMSASLSFSGPQTITPGATINVSNDNSFGQSGMVMDVDPTNPLRLAALAQHVGGQNEIDIYRSVDGGTSWAKTAIDNGAVGINDGAGAGVRFDPAVAYDAYGSLYVAYAVDTGTSTSIVVGRSWDDGASFSQFRTIATNTDIYNGTAIEIHGNAHVSLATGPDGLGGQAVYVAYIKSVIESGAGLDQRVTVDASNTGGNTFLGALTVNNISINGADADNEAVDVAVGPAGQLYVAWHNVNFDTGTDKLMFDRDLDGRFVATSNVGTDSTLKSFANNGSLFGWAVPAAPERGVYTSPSIAVDRSGGPNNGMVYLSYADWVSGSNTDIKVRRALNGGGGWTEVTAEASPGTDFEPEIAVDQNSGAVALAYYSTKNDVATGNDDVQPFLALSIDSGSTFSSSAISAQTSTEAGGYTGDYSEHIGLAYRDGAAHVLWASRHGAGTDLDAFTATAGLVSTTGHNVASTVHEYYGSQQSAWTLITRSGDYLVVTTGSAPDSFISTQEAFLATTVNRAIVNDSFNTDNVITIDSPPSGIELTVNGSYYTDYCDVVSLPTGTPTTFNGSNGDDNVHLSYNDHNLDTIRSSFTFNGDQGNDQITLDDELATGGNLYTVNSTSIARANFAGTSYDGSVELVMLYAGSGDDQVNVASTRAGATVNVYTEAGDDAVYLGTGDFGALKGVVNVVGGNGAYDAVIVVDNATAGSDHYTLNNFFIGRDGASAASYTQVEEVHLFSERGNNLISVNGTMPGCAYHLWDMGGTDTYDVQETDPSAPIVIEGSAGGDTLNVNTDNTGAAEVVFPYSQRIGALNVGNGGLVQLAPGASGDDHVLTVTSVSFGTGQLDLTNGDLIIDYTGASPLGGVQNYLTSGYFAGGWTGAGIMSSAAATDAQRQTALGFAEASEFGMTSIDGHSLDDTAIVVKYTWYGDADLNGAVDTVDFNLLAANFGGSDKQWSRGDFNFDTTTDTIDFNLLAANFARSGLAPASGVAQNSSADQLFSQEAILG